MSDDEPIAGELMETEGVALDLVREVMPDFRELLVDDPDRAAEAILRRIVASATPEEALRPRSSVGARERLGIPLEVRDVRLASSAYEAAARVFAILEVVNLSTGELEVITCGSINVLGQLYVLWRANALPARVRFTTPERPTRRGFQPLWLEPA